MIAALVASSTENNMRYRSHIDEETLIQSQGLLVTHNFTLRTISFFTLIANSASFILVFVFCSGEKQNTRKVNVSEASRTRRNIVRKGAQNPHMGRFERDRKGQIIAEKVQDREEISR
jgi:hypothetical protein